MTAELTHASKHDSRRDRLNSHLRMIVIAWVFGAFWLWTVSGATMTKFAKELGTPDWGFGVLTAIPFIATLAQLLVSYVIERFGHRRTVFLWCGVSGRLMWVALAAIPWVVPNRWAWWWLTMVAVLMVGQLNLAATGPTFMSWMADLVPRRIRGRYFGLRIRTGHAVGIVTSLAVAALLNWAEAHNAAAPGTMLRVTCVLLAVAGVVGALDVLSFIPVPDPYPHHPMHTEGWVSSLGKSLRNSDFRWFLGFNFTINLAVGFMGQYVWLYAFDVDGMSSMRATVLIVALPLLMQVLAYPMWGRLMDRLGKKPVMIVAGSLVVFGATGWMFIGKDAAREPFWHWHWTSLMGFALVLLTTIAWPGVDLTNFNKLLDLAGVRGDQGVGSAYTAINSVVCALGGIASGLLGGLVAGLGKDWAWNIPSLDLTLTYHSVLFLGSTGIRVLAVLMILRLHEPRAAPTRAAFGMFTSTLYDNVRVALFIPVRLVLYTPGRVIRHASRMLPWKDEGGER